MSKYRNTGDQSWIRQTGEGGEDGIEIGGNQVGGSDHEGEEGCRVGFRNGTQEYSSSWITWLADGGNG